MYIIGITGGSGAGKTTASRVLKSFGALTLDCDKIYHGLLLTSSDMKAELGMRFPGVLADGQIDRVKLGGIVFSDQTALNDLNAITHKYVGQELSQRIADWEAEGGTIAVIDAIALIESGINELCDVVIGVIAPIESRIIRIMRRDKIDREKAEMRIDAQKPDSFFEENCDVILRSRETMKDFTEECKTRFAGLINNKFPANAENPD